MNRGDIEKSKENFMNRADIEKSKEELIRVIRDLNIERVDPGAFKELVESYKHNLLRVGSGDIAWVQSYEKSEGHSKTHDNDTPGPYSKSWSDSFTA